MLQTLCLQLTICLLGLVAFAIQPVAPRRGELRSTGSSSADLYQTSALPGWLLALGILLAVVIKTKRAGCASEQFPMLPLIRNFPTLTSQPLPTCFMQAQSAARRDVLLLLPGLGGMLNGLSWDKTKKVSAAFTLSTLNGRIMWSKKSADCAISLPTPSLHPVATWVDAILVPWIAHEADAGPKIQQVRSGVARSSVEPWPKWSEQKWQKLLQKVDCTAQQKGFGRDERIGRDMPLLHAPRASLINLVILWPRFHALVYRLSSHDLS